MLTDDTPIETYKIGRRTVYVKREDLSCPPPGPPFSKMRGVVEHIANRPEKVFGVLDTFHSKAGWAVAYACKKLKRKCINFYPVYKADDPALLREPQIKSRKLGATLHPLPAGRSFILYNRARTLLQATAPGAYLMPNALKLEESVNATAHEVYLSLRSSKMPDNIIVSISSGTIAAGVMRGILDLKPHKLPLIWLHQGYSREASAITKYLEKMTGALYPNLQLIDEQYAYKDTAPKGTTAPFPCNPWYDLKAWAWLNNNINRLEGTVLFYNIGD